MRRHFDHLSDRQYRTHAATFDQNFQRADGQPSVGPRAKEAVALFPHPVPLR